MQRNRVERGKTKNLFKKTDDSCGLDKSDRTVTESRRYNIGGKNTEELHKRSSQI